MYVLYIGPSIPQYLRVIAEINKPISFSSNIFYFPVRIGWKVKLWVQNILKACLIYQKSILVKNNRQERRTNKVVATSTKKRRPLFAEKGVFIFFIFLQFNFNPRKIKTLKKQSKPEKVPKVHAFHSSQSPIRNQLYSFLFLFFDERN